MPSVLPLVVRTSFRFNGRFHNDRFVTKAYNPHLANKKWRLMLIHVLLQENG